MERDEKIDGLADHLMVAHEDHREAREDVARLLVDLERLTKAVRDGGKESYEIRMLLVDFTVEARLLVNDRIGEMSVERLAELVPRHKIDQVRALQYAREKGDPAPLPPPPVREPTAKLPTQQPDEDERRDPWYARLVRALLRTPVSTLLALALLLFAIVFATLIGYRLLDALDHSHLLPQSEQHEKKRP